MNLGTTFLPDAGGSHLWVVISDPSVDPDNVVIVNLTSLKDNKDHSCVLERGSHPWITHETCVDYRRARVVKLQELFAGKNQGALKIQAQASATMLQAIQEGAGRSRFLKGAARTVLVQQGLVQPPPPEEN